MRPLIKAVAAFRTNPLKEAQKVFDDPIPNTPWGHYGKGLREIHRTRNGLGLFTRTSSSDSGPSRLAEARDEGPRLGRSTWW